MKAASWGEPSLEPEVRHLTLMSADPPPRGRPDAVYLRALPWCSLVLVCATVSVQGGDHALQGAQTLQSCVCVA